MNSNIKHHRYKKLMVANRGEIAIRVLRAASELQIRTVAVYTYEDRYSLHRYKSDEAYQIGPDDSPLKPYLDIEELIKVAKEKNVDAIHPGYGFLSENVNFVRRCQEEGIIFIGPKADVMDRLGDKVAAKTLARELKIPIIEDNQVDLDSVEIAFQEAKRIGYPIMVKAASGGGGRGMRVVRSDEELEKAYYEASKEAQTAFGDPTIFLEKYIENPKHIEIQLLGDKYGNLVHLYERDCSVQRRFQKVVEVAPALALKQETKNELYKYALKIGQELDYSHAGTVEFLVDSNENVYFIEVNPRVQVEHTITEEVTGIDIVRSQILISMGYELSHPVIYIPNQESVNLSGYAIQCRVTTEDPIDNFKPDYGTLVAYRSASGFGIRLDAGSAYAGAKISPYFDSMLVKVTAKGRTQKGAAERLHRALREFRIRGVKTNVGFLLNLLDNEEFKSGLATVGFIPKHQGLLIPPRRRDRGTKFLKYIGNVIVNGHADIKKVDPEVTFRTPSVPQLPVDTPMPKGTADKLKELGREGFCEWLKNEKSIQFTDTTFRDGHQSLLATRMRTYDMIQVAEAFAKKHGDQLFSMEVWGGATFDVSMRFLKESPWSRLEKLRKAMPNVLLQMLLRGSNAVGYKAYPDNLIKKFIVKAAETGVDVFRIFDSLNWVEAMKVSIKTVVEETDKLAEACICYTGDILNPDEKKFNLQYYIDLAKELEGLGAHILAIKDMAGLLTPLAAEKLVKALKENVSLPIHLHTHDTSSIQAATYLSATSAGVDVIDVALSSMSGLTSQPNFNSVVNMFKGHERENKNVDVKSLNEFSNYWEVVREYYYPFETELKAGTAEVYDHEIPGGQYSNLRPQARGLGLEDKFETIKQNYRLVNDLFGRIVKVTPSSKVVGDMAMFMTANNYSIDDILNKGETMAFPDSVRSLMRGDLGQIAGGFPDHIQKLILQGEKHYTNRPNQYLEPINFEEEMKKFRSEFNQYTPDENLISSLLYPKVFKGYFDHREEYGSVSSLPTPVFYYGLKPNEEVLVEIEPGKKIIIQYLNVTEPNELGNRIVFFKLNGQTRGIQVKDENVESIKPSNQKATAENHVGSPLQGSISKIIVKEGDSVEANAPLFSIEAMKMESTIVAPFAGVIKKIHLQERSLVEQDDLVLEFE